MRLSNLARAAMFPAGCKDRIARGRGGLAGGRGRRRQRCAAGRGDALRWAGRRGGRARGHPVAPGRPGAGKHLILRLQDMEICHKFIYPCAVLFEMQRCCCAWSLHPNHPFSVAPGRTWAGMHPTSVPHNMRSWRNFKCPSVLLRM